MARIDNVYLLLLSSDDIAEFCSLLKNFAQLCAQKHFCFDDVINNCRRNFHSEHIHKLSVITNGLDDCVFLLGQAYKQISHNYKVACSIKNKFHYTYRQVAPKIAVLFAGQGSQYLNMGEELRATFNCVKKVWTDSCQLDWDASVNLQQVVFPAAAADKSELNKQNSLLRQTEWAQPAIGAVALSHIAMCDKLSLTPDYLGGHSYGEIVALYLAGVIGDTQTLLNISRARGEIMANATELEGAMLAVALNEEQAIEHIAFSNADVFVANINSPVQTVLSGQRHEIEAIQSYFDSKEIENRSLPVATAFHSQLIAGSKHELFEYISTKDFKSAVLPVYSNVIADVYPAQAHKIKTIIAEQLIKPVRFVEQINKMYQDGARLFVEMGPGSVLTNLVTQCLDDKPYFAIAFDQKRQNSLVALYNALGFIAVMGVALDFEQLFLDKITINNVSVTEAKLDDMSVDAQQEKDFLITLHNQLTEVQKEFQKTLTDAYESYLKVTSSLLGEIENSQQALPVNSVVEAAANSLDRVALEQDVLALISDKTGYPLEMLSQTMNLETDLGVDSLKRSEIISSFVSLLDEKYAYQCDVSLFQNVQSISEAIDCIVNTSNLSTQLAPAPTMSGKVSFQRTELADVLFSVIADKTGYPVEMLGLDMRLAEDLGVDSLKQSEIAASFLEKLELLFGLKLTVKQFNGVGSLHDIIEQVIQYSEHDSEPVASLTATEPLTADLERRVAILKPAAAIGLAAKMITQADEPIYLLKDNRGIAENLQLALDQLGANSVATNSLPKSAKNVICLVGLNTSDDVRSTIALNEQIFEITRKFCLNVNDQAGCFIFLQNNKLENVAGLCVAGAVPLGIDALSKVFANEWQEGEVKTISLNAETLSKDEVTSVVMREILSGGPEPEVTFNARGERYISVLENQAIAATSDNHKNLNDGDTMLVVGGGYGVAAGCLFELSKHYNLNFIILGRTKIAEPESEEVSQARDKESLIKVFLKQEKLKPLELDAKIKNTLKSREIQENLRKLCDNGSSAEYLNVDVCDLSLVQEMVAQLKTKYTSIDGIIYAAGIIDDNFINKQTSESFKRVFNTKVLGFYNMMQALKNEPLKVITAFSSIASKIGSVGQSNYAMANQVLNKLVFREQLIRGSACHARSINWGPWGGGMIDPALKRYFEEHGLSLISLSTGAASFVDEVESSVGGVDIVLAHAVDKFYFFKQSYEWHVVLNKKSCPLLQHHVLDKAVVPNALVQHWCLQLAKQLLHSSKIFTLSNIKMIKGIQVEDYDGQGEWLKIVCQLSSTKDVLYFKLCSSTDKVYYELQAAASSDADLEMLAADSLGLTHDNSWSFTAQQSYLERKLFVGQSLQVLSSLDTFSDKGCTATLTTPKHTYYPTDTDIIDISLLDGAIQLALLWRNQFSDDISLPTAVERLVVKQSVRLAFPVKCSLKLVVMNELFHKVDIVFQDASGEVIAFMQGLSMHVIKKMVGVKREVEQLNV